jgi:hypothetical protein
MRASNLPNNIWNKKKAGKRESRQCDQSLSSRRKEEDKSVRSEDKHGNIPLEQIIHVHDSLYALRLLSRTTSGQEGPWSFPPWGSPEPRLASLRFSQQALGTRKIDNSRKNAVQTRAYRCARDNCSCPARRGRGHRRRRRRLY